MAGLLKMIGREIIERYAYQLRALDRFFADPEYVKVPPETLRVSDIVVTLDIQPPSWHDGYYNISPETLAAIRAWAIPPREMIEGDIYLTCPCCWGSGLVGYV